LHPWGDESVPLNIELKPNEKIFINGAVIANGASRAQITILNDASILRERDIYTESTADTPCKRIYLAIQCMYMDQEGAAKYRQDYEGLAEEIRQAAPSTSDLLHEISLDVADGRLYAALKAGRKLIEYEQKLLDHAHQST
jgi:flagellar protein FlbT